MQIKRFGIGLLVAAGSLVLAVPAFAGFSSTMRLNGAFSLQDESTGDLNESCVVADFEEFFVFGEALGSFGDCTVSLFYDAFVPNKVNASTLKSDLSGKAQIQQKVETSMFLGIFASGEAVCEETGFFGAAPAKCKTKGRVDANEGGVDPDTIDKGKVDVNCDVGASFGQFGELSLAQIDTVLAAFDGRNDVKITDKGKIRIKQKAVADDGDFCD